MFVFFLPHPQETRFDKLGKCLQNMLSEAFWAPNTASSQLTEYSQLYSQTNVRPVKNGLNPVVAERAVAVAVVLQDAAADP